LGLLGEELREGLLSDKAQAEQGFAQQLAFALLFAQRQIELGLAQEAAVEQPVSES
jgi:hypothetical protein